MLLATVLLSAALVPPPPAQEIETPFDTPEAAPEEALPPGFEAEPAPSPQATPVPDTEPAPSAVTAAPGDTQGYIDAGLKAFIRGRFATARQAFQHAYDADPQSAAAAFYLGYAFYKLGEPSRRMDADKARARELFARAYTLDPMFQPVWGRKGSSSATP